MNATSPFEMKKEGGRVQHFIKQRWEKEAEKVAYEGCLAKFEQNEHLKSILLGTGHKDLVEASKDPIWGARLSLSDHNIFNEEARTGLNILGKAPSTVREQLRRHHKD